MNQSLYQISQDLQDAMEKVFDNQGEVTPELEALLEQIETTLTSKTDNIVEWVEYQEDVLELLAKKKKQIDEFKKKIEARLEKFDKYVEGCLKGMDKKSITGEFKKITVNKKRMVVEIIDPKQIPYDFINVAPEPETSFDIKAIEKVIKAGADVPGAHLIESKNTSIKYGWK